ncbi:MAG: hypothetical protein ACLQFR_10325 [Streptosporangiaceae bacterium]
MTVLAAVAQASTSAWAQPGTLGFLVVFGMGVILFFVFRSMSRHLRKVNAAAAAEATSSQTGEDADVQADAGAGGSAGPAAANGSRSGSGPL